MPLLVRTNSSEPATQRVVVPFLTEAVVALLEGGDNINRSTVDGDLESSYEGGLPLHIACGAGRREVALTLIERGANPYLKDRYGKTAFDYVNLRANSNRRRPIRGRLRVMVESDVRLYVTPESHPRRSRLHDVVPHIASYIV